jgi:DNA-binding GntR family transcriptional regulator
VDIPGRRAGTRGKLRYQKVIDLVERLIAERELAPGSLLPTQRELAELSGVSLITVRRALDELERDGRVAGHQGVGTFVARPRLLSEPARSGGLLSTLAENGAARVVSADVLDVRLGVPRPTVAAALRLTSGALVWRIERLRRIDGKPLVVEQALIPRDLAPDLGNRRADLGGSLYGLLARHYGLLDDYEEQYLEVRDAGARARRLLELPARAATVRLRGVSFTAQDRAFDCFEHVYPADELVFFISGQTARRVFRPTELNDWGVDSVPGRP